MLPVAHAMTDKNMKEKDPADINSFKAMNRANRAIQFDLLS